MRVSDPARWPRRARVSTLSPAYSELINELLLTWETLLGPTCQKLSDVSTGTNIIFPL